MKILGIRNPAQLATAPASAEIPVLAPISGEVVERLVAPGQVVQAGQTQAFTISNLSTVWVLANVYQADLAYVRSGEDVAVQTDAYPGVFHGRISYVSPALDPNTRTLQARIVVDNPGEKLKRDMYCTVTVTAGKASNAIAVPNAAVLRDDNNQPFVYVATGEGQFGRRDVETGQSEDGLIQILKGHCPRRQSCRRRQPLSAVCQLAAALRRPLPMINRIVQFALRQRFLVLMMVLFLMIGGAVSFSHMPVDAYPDLSPPMVEIITQWPGHAAEEVERLVTVPTEVEMNGVPKMTVMRSISLYGLSDIILTFHDDTDDYWSREVVFQRLSEVTYPTGVTPTLAPLASPSGLVYRYVLQSPDRTPQELKVYEDWVIERQYKQVPGVADDSGFGGTVMQYQVLLDPAKLYAYHITVPTVIQQLSVNNSNAGGGFYSQGGQFYYVRGLGLIRDTKDIGDVIVGSQNGVPVRVGDIGDVTIGHAPRLGEFGFNKTDDAVEGVIMMRRGEQTQDVLKGVEAKTRQLNEQILPPDVRVRPLLRSQRSGAAHHRYRRAQHGDGDDPGAHRADVFPGQLPRCRHRRAHHPAGAAVLLYLSACTGSRRQPALHWRHRFRNPDRWNPGDGGEYFPRTGRARRNQLRPDGGDCGGREGCRSPHLLLRRRHHRRDTCPSMRSPALPASSSALWRTRSRLRWWAR